MSEPTVREMLEGAARAVGIDLYVEWDDNGPIGRYRIGSDGDVWNPLADDGDALRLAVKLGISITPYPVYAEEARHSVHTKQRRHTDTLRQANPTECIELYGDDAMAATRLAIVRCAFEIGKGM